MTRSEFSIDKAIISKKNKTYKHKNLKYLCISRSNSKEYIFAVIKQEIILHFKNCNVSIIFPMTSYVELPTKVALSDKVC
ncbi:MAG: hypothetical protein WCB31_08670 [Nitrososphaeraceae archaeon]